MYATNNFICYDITSNTPVKVVSRKTKEVVNNIGTIKEYKMQILGNKKESKMYIFLSFYL